MRALVQGRVGIALRGTQAAQLSAGSRELLAQLGHLVLKPASPQSIELHSTPPARAVLQDGLVGISQRVSGTLRAGGDISLERAHYEISPFAVDNKRASWVALPDPKAQRLTAANIGPL